MKKSAAILALVLLLLTAAVLTGCSNEDNSEIVGEWKPSTVSINGTTISYSDLDTKGKDFSFNFYPDGKCKIIIGGVSNDGSYAFHQTSVDIQYGGKSQKLSYDHGILTLKLDYNDQTTAYMFTKVSNVKISCLRCHIIQVNPDKTVTVRSAATTSPAKTVISKKRNPCARAVKKTAGQRFP